MKIAIAQSSPENVGKTTTISAIYKILLEMFPEAGAEYLLDPGQDIRAVVTIRGIRIGIESQGDPWKMAARLEPSLALFVSLECEAIICATRTFGGTVDVVRGLENHGYAFTWRNRTREAATAMMYNTPG